VLVQVEIDEYRDYEKALSALREALKYMVKARAQNKEERCKQLQQKIYLVDRFVEARKVVKSDPNEMVKISHQLLEQPDVEQVRPPPPPPSLETPPRYALTLTLTHTHAHTRTQARTRTYTHRPLWRMWADDGGWRCWCWCFLYVVCKQAVRVGDVFALLVEFYHSQGNMQQAYVLIEKMQERKIIINPYLDTELVTTLPPLCLALARPAHARTGTAAF
jgi:hypothetical protein